MADYSYIAIEKSGKDVPEKKQKKKERFPAG